MIKGIVLLLITVVAWGVMYPSSKTATEVGIDGFYLSSIRYGFGVILTSLILLFSEGIKAFDYEGNFLKLAIYGTVGFAGLNIFTFVGITLSSAEHATIIFALLPMIGILLNWLFDGVKPSLYTLIFASISFAGIIIVITKLNFSASLSHSMIGDILLLIATVSWALYTYFMRQFSHWSALRATVLSSIPGTFSILLITAIVTMFNISTAPAVNTVQTVFLPLAILVATTAVIVTWNAGIKELGIVNGILFVNLVPIVTFFIGYLYGNPITKVEIIGAALTIFALTANNLYSRKRSPQKEYQIAD